MFFDRSMNIKSHGGVSIWKPSERSMYIHFLRNYAQLHLKGDVNYPSGIQANLMGTRTEFTNNLISYSLMQRK